MNSRQATAFRQWATRVLKEYLVKGFALDDDRLKGNGGGSYWRELLDRIRDIRSSEKVLYRQVLDLYATAVDYDPRANESTRFFNTVQNKLHFSAHGQTAAEVIFNRADVLQNAGSVSHAKAMEKAESEYRKYQERTLAPVEMAYLEQLKEEAKALSECNAKRRG